MPNSLLPLFLSLFLFLAISFHHAKSGTCPFGSSCFYKHVDENGKRPALEKARVKIDDSGVAEGIGDITISSFL